VPTAEMALRRVFDSPTRDSPTRESPNQQTRLLLWVGFGGLLLLMGGLGLSAISFLYQIEIRQERLRQDFVERDRTLERLRSNIFLSGTYIRDFLLDTNEALAAKHKSQFREIHRVVETGLEDYKRLLRTQEERPFQKLQAELSIYFETLAPALNWTAKERAHRGLALIQEEVLPRRMTAVTLADQIQQVSEKQLEASSQQISELFAAFRRNLIVLLLLTVAIGAALAGVTMWRLFRLEDEAGVRFSEVLIAREELQKLSAELVAAQENERRRLSRELHDEIGQVLSAMMLTLGNAASSIRAGRDDEALRQVQLAQDMTEQNARVVRNLSLVLRPTMLDDLGLLSALKWLAREVSRTTEVQVDVAAEQALVVLPEEHRTCVYRVTQEAVRNVTRHASARHVRIYLTREPAALKVSIQDDGKGFDPELEKGIGILGMKERVTRLGGRLQVDSERGRGAIVSFELPLPADLEASPTAPPPDPAHETNPLRTA
jgi:signal transduction histidine kinase